MLQMSVSSFKSQKPDEILIQVWPKLWQQRYHGRGLTLHLLQTLPHRMCKVS